MQFGAALSVGFDIDPQAIMSARHNATLNSIGPETMELHLVPGKTCSSLDGREDEMVKEQSCCGTGVISGTEKYDVVIANILLNPLLDLADHIVSYAKPWAVVGISGIISEQVWSGVARYSRFQSHGNPNLKNTPVTKTCLHLSYKRKVKDHIGGSWHSHSSHLQISEIPWWDNRNWHRCIPCIRDLQVVDYLIAC